MSKRIDEIRERLRGSHLIYIGADTSKAFENKKNAYSWGFQGTYYDAMFMARAADDIRFLLGEIDRLESEHAEARISDREGEEDDGA